MASSKTITHRTFAATAPEAGAADLMVRIRPRKLDFWEYEGTRAQLEAEDVIPAGTEWPESTRSRCWEVGSCRYWLRRCRPSGMKGPMKLWANGDWWFLRCELRDGPDYATRCILDKTRELAEAIYRRSAAGRRDWDANWKRYRAAVSDEAFQAFKTKVPGLIPPKRGRKLKINRDQAD